MKFATLILLVASTASAASLGFVRQSSAIYFSGGESRMDRHGHSMFHDIDFEISGRASRLPRFLRTTDVGARITYSAIRQARSWFGYQFGDPNDSVRGEWLDLFARRQTKTPHLGFLGYAEVGTGPMWSNRRVPAATSRLNFNSQVTFGAVAFSQRRFPVRFGYRFAHISNGGLEHRNPGLEVNQLLLGVEWKTSRANIPGR